MTVEPETALICSARGCRAPAVHQLRWNNPKLHAPAARKTWLACAAHRERLGDFLAARRFLREVLPAPSTAAADDRPPTAGGMDAMTP